MRVVLSDQAERELDEIGAYIARDNPERAASFVGELVEQCKGLAETSLRYPVVVEVRGLELRRCPFRGYLIFYAVRANRVEIAHVFHGARDYLRLLFPDA